MLLHYLTWQTNNCRGGGMANIWIVKYTHNDVSKFVWNIVRKTSKTKFPICAKSLIYFALLLCFWISAGSGQHNKRKLSYRPFHRENPCPWVSGLHPFQTLNFFSWQRLHKAHVGSTVHWATINYVSRNNPDKVLNKCKKFYQQNH